MIVFDVVFFVYYRWAGEGPEENVYQLDEHLPQTGNKISVILHLSYIGYFTQLL